MTHEPWALPPRALSLQEHEVHVWRARLDQSICVMEQLAHHLSSDERARAERFVFERDRSRFVVARGALRVILGKYLAVGPESIEFRYSQKGKPSLAGWSQDNPLYFNLAHSQDLAVYAFSRCPSIGIDVEHVRPIPEFEQIAASHFSPAERAMLASVSAASRQEAFFNCWTRKEAFVKAVGEGLSFPLDQFSVTLIPGEPCRLVFVPSDFDSLLEWLLEAFEPATGYVAACAMRARVCRFSHWTWDSTFMR